MSRDIVHEAPPKTGVDVIIRADLIANRRLNKGPLKAADFVLTPDVGLADWSDFHSIHALITAGMDATEKLLKQSVEILEPVLVGIE